MSMRNGIPRGIDNIYIDPRVYRDRSPYSGRALVSRSRSVGLFRFRFFRVRLLVEQREQIQKESDVGEHVVQIDLGEIAAERD